MPRSSRLPVYRRNQLRVAGVVLLAVVALIWLFSGSSKSKSSSQRSISGKPPVVLVTAFEEKGVSADYIKSIKDNRKQYAAKHGKQKTLLLGNFDGC